jgi:hypothetical protein
METHTHTNTKHDYMQLSRASHAVNRQDIVSPAPLIYLSTGKQKPA